MVDILAQLIANGLIAGSIYALVAAGFSLLYSTNRFIHFAHGSAITGSAYLLFWGVTVKGFPFILSIFISLATAIVIGWLCFLLVYNPLKNKKASNTVLLLASVGLLIFFENIFIIIFGPDVKVITYIPIAEGINILGARITPLQLIIMAVSGVLIVVLYLFISKNRYGKTMRAIANNPELAEIIGIPKKKFQHLLFIIGSALAGIAGILIALEQNVEAIMGTRLMILGFTSAVIGGLNSVSGGILGGFILGLSENLGVAFLPSGYKTAIAFTLLFLFLIFKPQGLFGVHKGTRE